MSDELFLRIVTDPGSVADPYPLLRELRETSPVHKVGFSNLWVLTRFDDCRAALRDNRLGIPSPGQQIPSLMPGAVYSQDPDDRGRTMLFCNPPEHTRLRSLADRALTAQRVEEMRASVESMTGELLDRLAAQGRGDLIGELAQPLAGGVLGELLGVPQEDRGWLAPLVADMVRALEPDRRIGDAHRALESRAKVRDYLEDLVRRRQAAHDDDLVTAMIEVRDGEDCLSPDEVAASVLLMYGAGLEPTASLIGSVVHSLMRWPDQLDRLRSDRSLARSAVEEVLRFESPVQVDGRHAFSAVEIGDRVIGAGHSVLMLFGAANRDPAVLEDPDQFDVGRGDVPLLSFGAGAHECFGAALARLVGQVVLEALLERFKTWTPLDANPPWKPRLTIRGLASLPVALS